MINLRFHIVSITAVFLALAIGIVMGSTLLERATIDSLKATQESLEEKIDQRVEENSAFRSELGRVDARQQSLATDVLPTLLRDQLDVPVLTIAARGVDEGALDDLTATLADAGATDVGTVWYDARLDVRQRNDRVAVADALGVDATDEDAVRDALVDRLVDALEPATAPPPAEGEVVPPSPEPTSRLLELDTAGLIDWAAPPSGVRDLPAGGMRVVVVSGEGAALEPTELALPVLRELARRRQGAAIAVELMNVRSSVGEMERRIDGQEPVRGAFVELIRTDGELAERVSTVDDGDKPLGRLSVVVVLAEGLDGRIGHYGETDSAQRQFPTPP